MPKNWTISEMKTKSDRELIIGFLVDRRETCTNVYAPLYEKISQILNKLDAGYGFNANGDLIDLSA